MTQRILGGRLHGAAARRWREHAPRRAVILMALGLLLPSTGCRFHHGPREEGLAERVVPTGVHVDVVLRNDTGEPTRDITAELLEVRADGVVLLLVDRIVHVDFEAITTLRPVPDALAPAIGARQRPGEAAGTLRVVARYPQGMPAVAMQRLLESLQQPELDRISRQP
jgi:hypothetical protein